MSSPSRPPPLSAMSSTSTVTTAGQGSSKRPPSIPELAERAEIAWDASKDFKFWLKTAERARHLGQRYDSAADYENAFVEYARAATLILDKIPTHRDYHTRLDAAQRETLISVRCSFCVLLVIHDIVV